MQSISQVKACVWINLDVFIYTLTTSQRKNWFGSFSSWDFTARQITLNTTALHKRPWTNIIKLKGGKNAAFGLNNSHPSDLEANARLQGFLESRMIYLYGFCSVGGLWVGQYKNCTFHRRSRKCLTRHLRGDASFCHSHGKCAHLMHWFKMCYILKAPSPL